MPSETPIERFDWKLDRASRELLHRGRRVRLAEKPFRVLEALDDAAGRVVTRGELRRLLWPDDTFVDFDNNLNSAVATLRQALGDSARAPRYIETLPRIGYRLVIPESSSHVSPLAASRRVTAALLGLALILSTVVLVAVRARTDRDEMSAPAASADEDAQALFERGLYLRGRFLVERDAELSSRALEAFREAGRLDPLFAPAAAEEAETLLEASFAGALGLRSGLEEAREAARRALALDPSNVAALRVASLTELFLEWDFDRARRWLDLATGDDPADARTSLAEATYCAALGRHEDAVRWAERAVRLDPAAYYVRADLALFYLTAGRPEDALESALGVLEVAPEFTPAIHHAFLAYERLDRLQEAAEKALDLMRLAGATEEDLAEVHAAHPRSAIDAWRRWDLERVQSMAEGRGDDLALQLALRYAPAGHDAAALDHLERAYARHDALLVFLAAFPELEDLRDEPRFERLARRIRRG